MKRAALAVAALALPGGGLLVGGWWLFRRWRLQTLTEKLDGTKSPRIAQWARELAAAAQASCPRAVALDRWAFTFAGIIDRESGGGVFLSPRGPAGTGDHGHGHGLGQVDDRPAKDDASDYEKQLGEKRLAHIASGDWTDPGKHLRFCAVEVFRGAYDQFSDVQDPELRLAAAVAAYNAGVDNVRGQLDAQREIDRVTTGQDYSADVLARADNWSALAA